VNAISPAATARAFDLTLCAVASVMEKHNKTLQHFPLLLGEASFLILDELVALTFFLLLPSVLSCWWMHFVPAVRACFRATRTPLD
jgi:hypothetical protein